MATLAPPRPPLPRPRRCPRPDPFGTVFALQHAVPLAGRPRRNTVIISGAIHAALGLIAVLVVPALTIERPKELDALQIVFYAAPKLPEPPPLVIPKPQPVPVIKPEPPKPAAKPVPKEPPLVVVRELPRPAPAPAPKLAGPPPAPAPQV
ncbi:MAG TPA: hypothetical protein VJS92_08740, partial [Candidatus Polarisedimenticolaceae bacterium]|nr:hypothetical protein [Candidatus Polarisedimenticolaceae bacterium]